MPQILDLYQKEEQREYLWALWKTKVTHERWK